MLAKIPKAAPNIDEEMAKRAQRKTLGVNKVKSMVTEFCVKCSQDSSLTSAEGDVGPAAGEFDTATFLWRYFNRLPPLTQTAGKKRKAAGAPPPDPDTDSWWVQQKDTRPIPPGEVVGMRLFTQGFLEASAALDKAKKNMGLTAVLPPTSAPLFLSSDYLIEQGMLHHEQTKAALDKKMENAEEAERKRRLKFLDTLEKCPAKDNYRKETFVTNCCPHH